MGQILLQSQTTLPISAGPVVQASDGITSMPGLLDSGITLTSEANGTATTLLVTANPGVTLGQIIAFKTGANMSGYVYCVSQSGSGPYTITFSPAAPNATMSGDTVLLCNLGLTLSKDAGAFAAPAGTTLTDIGRGYYSLSANATDMGSVGELKLAWDVYGATAGVSNEKEYQITAGIPSVMEGYASGEDPTTLVLGANAASWDTAGTIGAKINGAGGGSDPWATALPGSYSSGQAGNILGNNLNAAVSSRSTFAGGAVASVTGNVGGISGVTLPATIPSLAAIQAGLPTDASITADCESAIGATTPPNSAADTSLLSRISGNVAPTTGDAFARLGAPAGASVSADIAAANSALTLALSLIGQNQGVRNQRYDGSGNLLSADICAYDTASHATTNDGATGLVHKWSLALTYSGGTQATQSIAQVS